MWDFFKKKKKTKIKKRPEGVVMDQLNIYASIKKVIQQIVGPGKKWYTRKEIFEHSYMVPEYYYVDEDNNRIEVTHMEYEKRRDFNEMDIVFREKELEIWLTAEIEVKSKGKGEEPWDDIQEILEVKRTMQSSEKESYALLQKIKTRLEKHAKYLKGIQLPGQFGVWDRSTGSAK